MPGALGFMTLPLVLGTSSQWRRAVMDTTGVPYKVVVADIDEKAVTAGFPDRSKAAPKLLTLAIARAKAEAIVKKLQEPSILVTCDQVVFYKDTIREKPETAEECRSYIKSYKDDPVRTCSAVVVTNTLTGKQAEGTDIAEQYMTEVSDEAIDALIQEGSIMYTCGAVRVEAPEMQPFLRELVGTMDSMQGLPLDLMFKLIGQVVDASTAVDPELSAKLVHRS